MEIERDKRSVTMDDSYEGGAIRPWVAASGGFSPRVRLISPSVEYETDFLEFMREFVDQGNRRYVLMYPAARDDFPRYIRRLERAAKRNRLQPRFVQETSYWLQRDGSYIVGSCRLRHKLNRALKHEGGHIGYDIRPTERGKGYGTLQLHLLLEKARDLGLAKVLVTCDTDNIASARVIEKNRGLLEDRVVSHITGKQVSRYWIDLLGKPSGA